MDMDQELSNYNGIKNLEKIIIKPRIGNCVIFTPNWLHKGCKLLNGEKIILKCDISVKRNPIKRGYLINQLESPYKKYKLLGTNATIHEIYEDSSSL